MTWTKHGHHIPGSIETIPRPSEVARCGGPRLCNECKDDVAEWLISLGKLSEIEIAGRPNTDPPLNYNLGPFQSKALKTVYDYVSDRLEKTDTHYEFTQADVYIVWFSKTLQNWKALISTTLADQMYYEVTYDGERKCTYLDAYKKWENVSIQDEEVSDGVGTEASS